MSKVLDAYQAMYALMDELSEFGASDSEPRAVFRELMQAQWDGEEVHLPDSAESWQLFSDMPGAAEAARRLSRQAEIVLDIANANHRGFIQAMNYYF